MTPHPALLAVTPAAAPQGSSADPRSLHLAEALARLQDQAKTIRTPAALASDLLAEALLQRRYGQPVQDAAPAQPDPAPDAALTPGPVYAPQGRPGPLQVAPAPQVPPAVSPSPGVPALSAPAGTAIAVPAAASPAAGTAPAAAPGPSAAPPAQVLEAARAAIAWGADPERVRAGLAAHGYDAGAL